MLSARRSYMHAKKVLRSSRPTHIARATFAGRAFGGAFAVGTLVLALIAIVAPSNFGRPGAHTLRLGWPSVVLEVVVAACVVVAIVRRSRVAWLVARVREPFARPLQEEPAFEGAADALASCPPPMRARFALAWVWGPAAWAGAGVTFAFCGAYFVVDAVLARGRVGWAQPLYAVAFCAASLLVFAAIAGRLATWRLAASVNKEVTAGFA